MSPTKIEWTRGADGSPGMTWNPTLGCSKVGDPDEDGCSRCYAISVAHRAMQPAHEGLTIQRPGERPDWSGVVRCLPERLDTPLKRKKPTTYFVDSMSDLFHPDVPTEFIGSVWNTMGLTPQHTFQILTKRPQRMADVLSAWEEAGWMWRRHDLMWCGPVEAPLPNVWLGASIERDKYAFRANHVRRSPAAVRFLSLEPLLEPLPSLDLDGISWVIVGGESGPGARPMHPDWVRDIRDRCVEAGVSFFFKQWGGWAPESDHPGSYQGSVKGGHVGFNGEWGSPTAKIWSFVHPPEFMVGIGKKRSGRVLDGRTWDEMPERAA